MRGKKNLLHSLLKLPIMNNKHIVLAGGSGFAGQAMAAKWAATNRVTILTRNIANAPDNAFGAKKNLTGVEMLYWDARTAGEWVKQIDGCDILINLAGRSVNCRYNDKNKAEIMNSRVDATRVLGEAMKLMKRPPELFVSVASATIYRHAEDRPQDEFTGEIENDFSVQVCKAWEAEANKIKVPGTRTAILRMAIILGDGGVLVPYSWLARLGVGGKHGNGRQMFSWIHIEDVFGIIDWLYEQKDQQGTYNAAAPNPVPNKTLMKLLRDIYHIPIGIPAPAWLLRIATLIQQTETELLLKSRWVLPTRLQQEGYTFRQPKLKEALDDLLAKK